MMNFILIQNGTAKDITQLIESVSWSGRKGAAGRTLSAVLIDSKEYKYPRSGIDVEKGNQCIFKWEGKELFRGLIVKQGRNRSKKMQIEARDNLIYLANNDDSFNYKNVSASEIFIDCCKRYKIAYGDVVSIDYKIANLPKQESTLFDVILDALSQTYKATGERYYLKSEQGKAILFKRKDSVKQWVIETGSNLIDYDYSKSIEGIKTRIKLISDNGVVLAEEANGDLEGKIGMFQKTIKHDDKLNEAQLQQMVGSMLKEESTPKQNLNLTCLGISDVISGIGVYASIPDLDIKRSFYVDEDSHTFKGRYHEMKLTLNFTNEL